MTDDHYELSLAVFDAGEARDKLRAATTVILNLEKKYADAIQDAADSEAAYRLQLAQDFARYRVAGEAVEAAKIAAHGANALLSKERDEAAGRLKLAAERLDNARDTRRSLWRLIEWARERDIAKIKVGQQMAIDERVPADRWP
jgi:hypothetical protein